MMGKSNKVGFLCLHFVFCFNFKLGKLQNKIEGDLKGP